MSDTYRVPVADNPAEWAQPYYAAEPHAPKDVPDYARSFGSTLFEMRYRRNLSQSKLAEKAGFDHSYVSRLESQSRMPTRAAVIALADAMFLDSAETDSLLASAGFLPTDTNSLVATEPSIVAALNLFRDNTIPLAVRDDVRHMLTLLVRQAERTRGRT